MATPKARGMHHMALVTKNMDETVKFWGGILGCKPKVMLHLPDPDPFATTTWEEPMGNLGNSRHYFFDIGNGDSVAFFDIGDQDVFPESMASGFAHHLALGVDTEEDLVAAKEHLESHGVEVSEVVNHFFCKSIYFRSPEGHYLEYATYTGDWSVENPFIQDDDPTPATMDIIGQELFDEKLIRMDAGREESYPDAQ